MSTKVAGLAKKNGYTNIRIYQGGRPAWIKAGNLVYADNQAIENGNIVLIDLRSIKKSENGRITRSVSIPYPELDSRIDGLALKAPIVLYSDSHKEVARAVRELRAKGFKKVALVAGNYAGWVQAGGTIVRGPVVTDIHWRRKLGKGEVSREDFLRVVNGKEPGAVTLDVRTKEEVMEGRFKNSLTIPLDQISSRLAEIPKNKKIYVYSSTGARADMCAQELKKNGYKAYFLRAEITCTGNNCDIED